MHSPIIQLSYNPVPEDEYITPDDIRECDIDYFGMDYVSHGDSMWGFKDVLDTLERCLPKGMFVLDKENRKLIPTDDDSAMRVWFESRKEKVSKTSYESFITGSGFFDLRHMFTDWLEYGDGIVFHFEDWCGGCQSFLRTLLDIFYDHKGKEIYIGGVLDYHY